MEDDQRTYEELTAALMEGYLKELLEQGIPEKAARSKAEKHAIEDARYVLPNACATRIMMTANARQSQELFPSALLQPRTVGNPRARRNKCTDWSTLLRPDAVRTLRSGLC